MLDIDLLSERLCLCTACTQYQLDDKHGYQETVTVMILYFAPETEAYINNPMLLIPSLQLIDMLPRSR